MRPAGLELRERDLFNPLARMDGEERKDRGDDAPLPEDNQSIRELTEIFKPLPTAEYLKQQAKFSKDFSQ